MFDLINYNSLAVFWIMLIAIAASLSIIYLCAWLIYAMPIEYVRYNVDSGIGIRNAFSPTNVVF